MAHPLVVQLRFARSEFVRGLTIVNDPEAQQRFGSMNCLSWIVGHLAWQEQRYWLTRAQGQVLVPMLNDKLAYGKPACTPPVDEMWDAWRQVTLAADPWLDALTSERIQAPLAAGFSSVGTFLQRVLYHYWYHLGEGMAIRQMLGHTGLPDFVGNIDDEAPYRPENGVFAHTHVSKEDFVRQVQEARARLDALLDRFPSHSLEKPLPGETWAVKDVMSHITWHEREMLNALRQRALVGSDLWQEPLEVRNQAIYEQYRDTPLETVLSDYKAVYNQMHQELQGLSDDDLNLPDRFAEMPPGWRISQILAENTFQHYDDHAVVLRGWLNHLPGKE